MIIIDKAGCRYIASEISTFPAALQIMERRETGGQEIANPRELL